MSLVSEIRKLPRIAWILFAGGLVNRFGSFVLVFMVLYLKDQGYSATQSGLAMGAYGAGAVVAALAGGWLADVFGRRNTIVLSMSLSAIAVVSMIGARTLGQFIALAVAAGATGELYRPAAAALLTDVTSRDHRVTAFGAYRLAINFGMALGPAVGGFLYEYSREVIFVGDAVTSLAFCAVALFALPNRTAEHEHTIGSLGAVGVIVRDRYFMLFLASMTLGALVYMQGHTAYPLQLDAYGHSAKAYGLLISINAFLVMTIELPITQLTRRRNPQGVMLAGFWLVAAGFAMTGFVSTIPLLAVSVMIWTMGEIVMMPVASAQVANIAPDHMRGRYQGAFTMTFSIGAVLAPILGTAVYEWSPRTLWVLCGVVCAAGGLLVGLARPGFRKGA